MHLVPNHGAYSGTSQPSSKLFDICLIHSNHNPPHYKIEVKGRFRTGVKDAVHFTVASNKVPTDTSLLKLMAKEKLLLKGVEQLLEAQYNRGLEDGLKLVENRVNNLFSIPSAQELKLENGGYVRSIVQEGREKIRKNRPSRLRSI